METNVLEGVKSKTNNLELLPIFYEYVPEEI